MSDRPTDAVETEDEPFPGTVGDTLDEPFYPPSPARDDAEIAIAGLLAEHAPSHQVDGDYGEYQWVECICDSDYFEDTDAGITEHRAHVASVLAAHMAAPDELTALREESAGWRTEAYDARKQIADLAAERDALRKGVRSHAEAILSLAASWEMSEAVDPHLREVMHEALTQVGNDIAGLLGDS